MLFFLQWICIDHFHCILFSTKQLSFNMLGGIFHHWPFTFSFHTLVGLASIYDCIVHLTVFTTKQVLTLHMAFCCICFTLPASKHINFFHQMSALVLKHNPGESVVTPIKTNHAHRGYFYNMAHSCNYSLDSNVIEGIRTFFFYRWRYNEREKKSALREKGLFGWI